MTEERICELEDKSIEIIQNEEHREKKSGNKNEQSLGAMLSCIKWSNIHISRTTRWRGKRMW